MRGRRCVAFSVAVAAILAGQSGAGETRMALPEGRFRVEVTSVLRDANAIVSVFETP